MYKPKRPAAPNYLRHKRGPYRGSKPGIGKKHYPNVPVDTQLGPRPMGT